MHGVQFQIKSKKPNIFSSYKQIKTFVALIGKPVLKKRKTVSFIRMPERSNSIL